MNSTAQLNSPLNPDHAERLTIALNAARMGMWDWNIATGEIKWSPEHEQLFGLPPHSFDGRYETFYACLHPDDRDGLNQVVAFSLRHHAPYQHEFRVVWADGSVHWIEGRGQAFYSAAGEAVRMTGTVMSIDDRKQLEHALKQSEQLFRAIFEAESECVKVVTVDGILQNMNPAGLAMIEADSLEAVQGQCVCPLIDPAHQQAFLDFTHQVIQGTPACLEFEITGLKGTRRWLESRGVPLQTSDQGETLVLAVTRDITERKQAELALQEQESLLRLFAQFAPAGIAMFDREMRYVMASQRWIDEYCLDSVEAVVGRSHYEIFPEIPDHWRQIHQRCMAGAIEKCDDDLFIRADGSQQWVSWEIRPWYRANGEIGGIIIFSVDVTQRKLVEEILEQRVAERTVELTEVNDRLSQSEEKFRQLAENIQDVIWITDAANQQVLYVNPIYETLWGRSRESLYQDYTQWLSSVHPEDQSRVLQTLQEKGSQGAYDHEYRILSHDGSVRWIRDRAFPIKNAAGEIIRLAGIAEDITERQRVEEIKNEFISIVSHELRTPLTAIQMSLGLLKSGIYANKPEKAQRMIEIAFTDTHRLVNLVNDILDLERLESGRAVLEPAACRAEELMQQAVDGMQSIAAPQKITLAIAPTAAVVWAAGDTIIQTLTNLLSNALKFSPADSVIQMSAEQIDEQVLFKVCDRGRGIPADKLESIFGRFQQVDASDSREKGGTGLGLPICRSIVERQGGKIWAESTLGEGSTFCFTLAIPSDV